jgi:hypothetical protein
MKRWFTLQEHNARRARLHWDLRFEWYPETVDFLVPYLDKRTKPTPEPMGTASSPTLRSFCVPKHHWPEWSEYLLAIPTEDHPWEYRKFAGTIPEGSYGAGHVQLLFGGLVEVYKMKPESVIWQFGDKAYEIFASKEVYFLRRIKCPS